MSNFLMRERVGSSRVDAAAAASRETPGVRHEGSQNDNVDLGLPTPGASRNTLASLRSPPRKLRHSRSVEVIRLKEALS